MLAMSDELDQEDDGKEDDVDSKANNVLMSDHYLRQSYPLVLCITEFPMISSRNVLLLLGCHVQVE
ncbi:hypothetical protein SLEP1_g21317 [Rubroshorea leprosula]|uniref:Uncharacterized protein n=1 Tax=Rubroshorea leprosula TaxID=152421 RepID=A0AAV5J5I8_9ROSI|nr:hypothetical protein SLEP1_g21317 [Rubroshorea leprosula]